jgi:hypothetical protein
MNSPKYGAQISKRKLLPEIGLIGPVQILGVRQKFTFPFDIDLLCNSTS